MIDELRDRLIAFLLEHRVGVLATRGTAGAWAIPVWFRLCSPSAGASPLGVECLVPLWADVAFHLEQDPQVLLVVRDEAAAALRWLQIRGVAGRSNSPAWGGGLPPGTQVRRLADQYLIVHVEPERIDLINDERGWGARETLDL